MNPSQLLAVGGVWRLSTLPAGHDVYVLPYAIKWCGLSIVNCFRRWILFFAVFWFSLRENHNKMNEHLLFWKHLCAYINVSWHWLARTSLQWAVFYFLLFNSIYGNRGCGVFKGGYKIRKILAEETIYSKEIIEFWVLDKSCWKSILFSFDIT